MKMKDAEDLIEKVRKVLLSCESADQLLVGMTFHKLAVKKIENSKIKFKNRVKLHILLERSIGFSLCKIKMLEEKRKSNFYNKGE